MYGRPVRKAGIPLRGHSPIKTPTSSLITTLHHFKAFLTPPQRRYLGLHRSHAFYKPTRELALFYIVFHKVGTLGSWGMQCLWFCFTPGPTILRVPESQTDCLQLRPLRIQLSTDFRKLLFILLNLLACTLTLLIGLGGAESCLLERDLRSLLERVHWCML